MSLPETLQIDIPWEISPQLRAVQQNETSTPNSSKGKDFKSLDKKLQNFEPNQLLAVRLWSL